MENATNQLEMLTCWDYSVINVVRKSFIRKGQTLRKFLSQINNMLNATLKIKSDDSRAIASSLMPETERDLSRTRTDVLFSDGVAVISIDSKDTVAMRAALNSYLECIKITEEISRIAKVNV